MFTEVNSLQVIQRWFQTTEAGLLNSLPVQLKFVPYWQDCLLMQEIIKSCFLSKQIWGPAKIQVVHRATGLIMTTASFQVNAQH